MLRRVDERRYRTADGRSEACPSFWDLTPVTFWQIIVKMCKGHFRLTNYKLARYRMPLWRPSYVLSCPSVRPSVCLSICLSVNLYRLGPKSKTEIDFKFGGNPRAFNWCTVFRAERWTFTGTHTGRLNLRIGDSATHCYWKNSAAMLTVGFTSVSVGFFQHFDAPFKNWSTASWIIQLTVKQKWRQYNLIGSLWCQTWRQWLLFLLFPGGQ